jgi:NADPH:quinone reductase-like Zn-dependent oxidoreductase
MKALYYREFGKPDVIQWAEFGGRPKPGKNDVLVRVIAGALNPKDALLRKGVFPRFLDRTRPPRISGLDICGEVVARGEAVRGLQKGDLVFGMTNHFAGGLHAEYAVIAGHEVAVVPRNLTPVEASAVPLAALTALQALRDNAGVGPGSQVLINGASGGVGHFAVQIARILGATVTAVCSAANADFVTDLGANRTVDYNQVPAPQAEGPFDAIFDVFGQYHCRDFRPQLAREGIYVNTIPRLDTARDEGLARLGLQKRSRLVIVHSNREDLELLRNWIELERLKPVIDAVYPASDVLDAYRHIESRRTRGKVVIEIAQA